jgi:DNA invertase Pin-like site-specific DNA recombinase
MEIVQDYSDHGRSGLNIAGREGLDQLMADVEAKPVPITCILLTWLLHLSLLTWAMIWLAI